MSNQYNKGIKRKRRLAYKKRRKIALKTALAAKGVKPGAKAAKKAKA